LNNNIRTWGGGEAGMGKTRANQVSKLWWGVFLKIKKNVGCGGGGGGGCNPTI